MIKPRDKLRPQSRARVVCTFLAIALGWLGLYSTWRMFSLGQPILTPILGGFLFGLIYILVDRIWRREGEYLKRYTDVDAETRENYANSPNLRH